MRAQKSLGPLMQRSFFTHPLARLHQRVTGEDLRNPRYSCQRISAACQVPPNWQGCPAMHQLFLPAWSIFYFFLPFSSEGLISSCWLDFGSLAAAPASPLSTLECLVGRTVGSCTSRWSCPSLSCQLPWVACPPQIYQTCRSGMPQSRPCQQRQRQRKH